MLDFLPKDWTPDVSMDRIIGHWTGGGHKANSIDRKAYHALVEGDANVVRGIPSIALNSGRIQNGYAAHTLNCNTGSIGVAMCGMAGAVESPYDAGSAPLTREQFMRFVQVVAELCRRYGIPVTPRTVLFHAEVQATLGIRQRNKWDVAVLPFDQSVKGARVIGDYFRSLVSSALGEEPQPEEEPVPSGAQVRVTANRLNFRSGPGTGYEAMGNGLPRDTVVMVDEMRREWLKVVTPAGYIGWVARQYVEIIDGPPVESPTTPNAVREFIGELRSAIDRFESRL